MLTKVKNDVRSQLREEVQAQFQEWGQPAYRVNQLLEWLYVHKASSWDALTNLPKALRERLAAQYSLSSLELLRKQGARDATQKFLWKLTDGALIESVLIPANPALYGESSDRHTLCVSTQVGCAYGCKFCASGLEGWKRNLRVDEMVEQVLAVERWHEQENKGLPAALELVSPPRPDLDRSGPSPVRLPEPGTQVSTERLINNLVIMGMGEPLANYDNLLKALAILNAPWGGGIGARKITVSTSGLVPQIRRLAEESFQFRLAISLHGATDKVRSQIMPINRRFPISELTAACEYYVSRKGKMITLEYILIGGVNDGLDQVQPLAELARRLNAKVNLIPYNKVEGLSWQRPSEAAQESFLSQLEGHRIMATLRREKGHDIDAACGQLRLQTERALRALPELQGTTP